METVESNLNTRPKPIEPRDAILPMKSAGILLYFNLQFREGPGHLMVSQGLTFGGRGKCTEGTPHAPI